MHYTSASGLFGIITSKTIWASHNSFLNDSEEVEGFFSRVPPAILRPELEKYLAQSQNVDARILTVDPLGINHSKTCPEAVATGMRITFAVATILIVVALAIAVGTYSRTLREYSG